MARPHPRRPGTEPAEGRTVRPATAPGGNAATPRSGSARATVVVRPGDCLWRLAASSLDRGADDAAIAQAWPAWWAANRSVIGPDPDLLVVGMHLVPPRR